MNIALSIRNVRIIFSQSLLAPKPPVLGPYSIDVASQTSMALVGKNGQGKTSLIRCILNQQKYIGDIFILGQKATSNMSRFGVGYVQENVVFVSEYTGLEILTLHASILKISVKACTHVAERTGIAYALKNCIGTYSKGMKQRLALAVALLNNPLLLILDEPFTGLDAESIVNIKHILHEEKKRGATLVMALHDEHDIQELCNERYDLLNAKVSHVAF